ncbi:MAG: nucleoside 2-deoxyribosyltransferase [Clostridium sp.]|nr:nucleoside 2-deoxyribosyltransferase [Clostridium sp.]
MIKNIEILNKVKEILRGKGLEVFVPMEHQNPQFEFGILEWRAATFKSDVDAIDEAYIMVALINKGNYDDSGTAWEIGYAYVKGIDVVVLNITRDTINLMIADSLHSVLTSYEELEEYDFDKMEKKPYLNYVW